MNHPEETALAKKLHAVYRKWAGNMGAGDHLPETWNAVAAAAEAEIAAGERTTRLEPSSTANIQIQEEEHF
jgi:hypothetical protein